MFKHVDQKSHLKEAPLFLRGQRISRQAWNPTTTSKLSPQAFLAFLDVNMFFILVVTAVIV